MNTLPLSLYIHIPWCIKKCPYCDFNSYTMQGNLPEESYINTLIHDLKQDLPFVQNRSIKTIFFGGGTPSLFTPKSIEKIISQITLFLKFETALEITLEANPGTIEHQNFHDYKQAGITRISLGAQSFQDTQLSRLGRIHKASETEKAIERIIQANFKSFNIDIMYGLPDQTVEEALLDLKTALSFSPPHLSWYNLTIEPNTIFHHQKPSLPPDETIATMEELGKSLLQSHDLMQYEVSAYSIENHQCQHNLNYWEFGDYLGIGAGAHGKITYIQEDKIIRYSKTRTPKNYLANPASLLASHKPILHVERPLEFMLNALRLPRGIPIELFEKRTLLSIHSISSILENAEKKELLEITNQKIIPTALGKQFLNDLIALFM